MIDIFDNQKIDLTNLTCNSGGAEGADTVFENVCMKRGIKVNAFSYKTKYHNSPNKVEISDTDYNEGVNEINKANHLLNRYGAYKYMNLLARNWAQVKYSSEIFAIGTILNPGEKSKKGYRCNSKYQSVDGGTGYAVQMAICNNKPVYVFDQDKIQWFRWSYTSLTFIKCDVPKIKTQNFAGVGTREINQHGINAINDLLNNTFAD